MSNLWDLSHLEPRTQSVLAGETMAAMFWNAVQARGPKVWMRQKELGLWRAMTWQDTGTAVHELGHGLLALGFGSGATASILSNTRLEWVLADLAVLSCAGVSNGIYPTDAASQVQFLCEDSGTTILFVEDDEQLDKALEARAQLPHLRHIVVFDMKGLHGLQDPMVMSLDDLRALGREHASRHPQALKERVAACRPEDLAILVYTSGTTGKPKGAMHTHGALTYTARGFNTLIARDENDECMCFLPLCHIAERMGGEYFSLYTGSVLNFVENPETVPENVREIARTRRPNRIHLSDAFCGMCGLVPPGTPSRCLTPLVAQSRHLDQIGRTGGPWVGLIVGAGDTARQVPVEIWRTWIVRFLGLIPRGRVVLLGSGAECDRAQKIQETLPPSILGRIWDITGRTTIHELAQTLSRCQRVIGADTGPLHLAAAAFRSPRSSAGPPGYTTEATQRAGIESMVSKAANTASYSSKLSLKATNMKDIVDGGYVIVGSPDEVAEQIRSVANSLNVGHLMLLLQYGNMSKDLTKYNTRLFAEAVMPKVRDLFGEWEDRWWPKPMARDQRAAVPAFAPARAAE